MSQLLTYDDYTSLGYNTVPSEQFERYYTLAMGYVREVTLERIMSLEPPVDTDIQMAIAETMDILKMHHDQPKAKSVSNDGYSVTYVDDATASDVIYDLLLQLLPPHLTYRGLCS